ALLAGLVGALVAGMFLSHSYRLFAFVPVAFAAALGRCPQDGRARWGTWKHYVAVPAITTALIGVIYLIVEISK
ncbi:MAG TPA: hypothetical protein VGX50_07035, partial [Longimicrobium sp.]|nr:hypothetical protein [Longimicrobium sp.]